MFYNTAIKKENPYILKFESESLLYEHSHIKSLKLKCGVTVLLEKLFVTSNSLYLISFKNFLDILNFLFQI